jgi:hypothetical protein
MLCLNQSVLASSPFTQSMKHTASIISECKSPNHQSATSCSGDQAPERPPAARPVAPHGGRASVVPLVNKARDVEAAAHQRFVAPSEQTSNDEAAAHQRFVAPRWHAQGRSKMSVDGGGSVADLREHIWSSAKMFKDIRKLVPRPLPPCSPRPLSPHVIALYLKFWVDCDDSCKCG